MRVKAGLLFLTFAMMILLLPGLSYAQNPTTEIKSKSLFDYSGYFSREENDGKMARLSGNSHYMKFYSPDRIIRLFIPYPYSSTVKPETISEAFHEVSKMTVGEAFIRGGFAGLEQDAIANISRVKTINDEIKFDCDASAPCKILFRGKVLKIIKKGILTDHVIVYDYIDK